MQWNNGRFRYAGHFRYADFTGLIRDWNAPKACVFSRSESFMIVVEEAEAKVIMGRIVVIGGSGHVGSYLLPALVERGHEVLNVSRGTALPYREHAAWEAIEHVAVDRKTEEAEGTFGARIADLNADIVVDMISFELEGASS